MRRCKYFYSEARYTLGFYPLNCEQGLSVCYTPVELDPYWKDIVDETNRRLNEQQRN